MRKVSVIASAILTAAFSASAQDSEFARSGPYLGIAGSVGFYTGLEDEIEEIALALGYIVTADVDASLGFNARAGYRVSPWVAVELEYEHLLPADAEVEGIEFAEVRTLAFTGNVKVYPLHGRFQPFVIAGLGSASQRLEDSFGAGLEETDTVAAGRFGGGLDAYVTRNVALSLEVTYLLPFSDLNEADGNYVSIGWGVQYRF
jgi:opacity protein-like surface antigen